MTGLRRYANKRDANEPEIVWTLQSLGCIVYRLDKPVDLLVAHKAGIYLIEIKVKKGKMTKSQKDFTASGFPVWIIRSRDEAIEFVLRTGGAGILPLEVQKLLEGKP